MLVLRGERDAGVSILLCRCYAPLKTVALCLLSGSCVHSGDPSSGDTQPGDTAVTSSATQAAPPTVVSKLVRGGPIAGGSSGAQTKRPSRSIMCVLVVRGQIAVGLLDTGRPSRRFLPLGMRAVLS